MFHSWKRRAAWTYHGRFWCRENSALSNCRPGGFHVCLWAEIVVSLLFDPKSYHEAMMWILLSLWLCVQSLSYRTEEEKKDWIQVTIDFCSFVSTEICPDFYFYGSCYICCSPPRRSRPLSKGMSRVWRRSGCWTVQCVRTTARPPTLQWDHTFQSVFVLRTPICVYFSFSA